MGVLAGGEREETAETRGEFPLEFKTLFLASISLKENSAWKCVGVGECQWRMWQWCQLLPADNLSSGLLAGASFGIPGNSHRLLTSPVEYPPSITALPLQQNYNFH